MIAVRGLQMPDSCMECFFMKNYECSVMPPDMSGLLLVPDNGRASWCPLREIKSAMITRFYTREDVERFGEQNVVGYTKRDVANGLVDFLEKENMISYQNADAFNLDDEDVSPSQKNRAIVATLRIVVPKGEKNG